MKKPSAQQFIHIVPLWNPYDYGGAVAQRAFTRKVDAERLASRVRELMRPFSINAKDRPKYGTPENAKWHRRKEKAEQEVMKLTGTGFPYACAEVVTLSVANGSPKGKANG